VGMAAGAFSEGDRFPTSSQLNGNWERTIAIYRTTYSHVTQVQCRKNENRINFSAWPHHGKHISCRLSCDDFFFISKKSMAIFVLVITYSQRPLMNCFWHLWPQARTPSATVPALQAGLVWFGPHVASTTVFAPYAATGVNGINPMLSVGDPHTLARNSGMVGCNEAISSI
jgi:hypothetical protein